MTVVFRTNVAWTIMTLTLVLWKKGANKPSFEIWSKLELPQLQYAVHMG